MILDETLKSTSENGAKSVFVYQKMEKCFGFAGWLYSFAYELSTPGELQINQHIAYRRIRSSTTDILTD